MAEVVLDASAILAALLGERGWEEVIPALPRATVSAVNLAEVVAKLVDRSVPPEVAAATAGELELAIAPFDEASALQTGILRATTRRLGLSLGDRACLALARTTGLPVMTADRAWAELDLGVEVVLIR